MPSISFRNSQGLGLGAALGLLALAFVGREALGWGWLQLIKGPPDLVLLSGVANLVVLTAVAALGYRYCGGFPVFRPQRTGPGLVLGLIAAAAGGTIVLGELANLVTAVVPIGAGLAAQFNSLTRGNLAVALFTVVFVAPFTEELLFRGVLLKGFSDQWGRWPALVLSSALFGLFHFNVWQAPSAFLAGLFLGWLFLKTGSLLYPMAAHALFNALPVVLDHLGLEITGYNSPVVTGMAEFQPLPWLAAGAVLTVAGLWMTNRWAPLSPPPVSDRMTP